MSGKNVTEVRLADADGIAKAAQILESGGLVAVPTETVYGLAARADCPEAVARIYAAKGRPDFNPLIVHVAGAEQAQRFADFSDTALALAEAHWPGPLTLVLPRRADAGLAAAVTAGLPTVALRAPAHPAMRALLELLDFPLAAPSANRSGFISPTCADHVLASLDGRIAMVLDGGPTTAGVESTIVAVRADGSVEELRPGPLQLGVKGAGSGIEAPGQLASHYAPGKPVRLNATEAAPDEFLIGFGAVAGDCTLSAGGDVNEAASRLYACLHEAARAPQSRIAIAPVSEQGVGRAINDRLRRAAA
ncbi:MAG: L-threonylcarbamoyladenylate synthase [Erythrobacter sp.]|jgi:L-threonylcarbamoyladenylate synthase|uniref:L-threonylcarbamoyladenylate synthase n=1 Tax=Erythrobacter sp. TaxID=1042 RepID=UPI002B46F943|nr:L-threonylcarbamoyladenylate synthase [Erythrobacter sp.]WRH69584.1 MAG: L-threonylcarbamoyladenylate synthase [Erythrobacter sp.]